MPAQIFTVERLRTLVESVGEDVLVAERLVEHAKRVQAVGDFRKSAVRFQQLRETARLLYPDEDRRVGRPLAQQQGDFQTALVGRTSYDVFGHALQQ